MKLKTPMCGRNFFKSHWKFGCSKKLIITGKMLLNLALTTILSIVASCATEEVLNTQHMTFFSILP